MTDEQIKTLCILLELLSAEDDTFETRNRITNALRSRGLTAMRLKALEIARLNISMALSEIGDEIESKQLETEMAGLDSYFDTLRSQAFHVQ